MNEPQRKTLRARLRAWLKSRSTHGVDPDVVRDMAKLLDETGLSEIEIERGRVRVRVAKNGHSSVAVVAPTGPAPERTSLDLSPPAPLLPTRRGIPVPSPMVGTLYLSPKPGAPSFVRAGSEVKEGDTICIIEAMKTMNAVPAPISGRIAEIQIGDAQPVEYGQILMTIE